MDSETILESEREKMQSHAQKQAPPKDKKEKSKPNPVMKTGVKS